MRNTYENSNLDRFRSVFERNTHEKSVRGYLRPNQRNRDNQDNRDHSPPHQKDHGYFHSDQENRGYSRPDQENRDYSRPNSENLGYSLDYQQRRDYQRNSDYFHSDQENHRFRLNRQYLMENPMTPQRHREPGFSFYHSYADFSSSRCSTPEPRIYRPRSP